MKYTTKHVFHIGSLDIERVTYPAELRDDEKAATLFEVYDADCTMLNSFSTFHAAMDFAERYTDDPTAALAKMRQLSDNRLTHLRALAALALLSASTGFVFEISNAQNPEPIRIEGDCLFVIPTGNEIQFSDYGFQHEYRIGDLASVRKVSDNSFRFKTQDGQTVTITGLA